MSVLKLFLYFQILFIYILLDILSNTIQDGALTSLND